MSRDEPKDVETRVHGDERSECLEIGQSIAAQDSKAYPQGGHIEGLIMRVSVRCQFFNSPLVGQPFTMPDWAVRGEPTRAQTSHQKVSSVSEGETTKTIIHYRFYEVPIAPYDR